MCGGDEGVSCHDVDTPPACGCMQINSTTAAFEAGLQNLGADLMGSEDSRLAESERGVWVLVDQARHLHTPL